MESQLKYVKKITIRYNDSEATDSDSDVDDLRNSQPIQPKRKDIVILPDKFEPNPLPVCQSGDELGKNDNTQKIQRTQKPQHLSELLGVNDSEIKKGHKLQQGTSSKFPGVRKREWGEFTTEIRNPFNNKKTWLGTVDTKEEAVKACQSKKADFEMIMAKMNKMENNLNCLQRAPSSVLNVSTFDDMATTPTNSKENVVNMANARLLDSSNRMKKPLLQIPEMNGRENFDLKKIQALMYSWYVEESLEVAAPVKIIRPTVNELGAWQPSKKSKVCFDESIPISPPLSPILNFEQNMRVGNDLKELGFEENFEPNCDGEDELSDLFELKPFPMSFPDQELDEQD